MRKTTIRGLDDNFYYNLGSDTTIITSVMEIADDIGDITYSKTFKGSELIDFIIKYVKENESIIKEIKKDNKYELTAYDW